MRVYISCRDSDRGIGNQYHEMYMASHCFVRRDTQKYKLNFHTVSTKWWVKISKSLPKKGLFIRGPHIAPWKIAFCHNFIWEDVKTHNFSSPSGKMMPSYRFFSQEMHWGVQEVWRILHPHYNPLAAFATRVKALPFNESSDTIFFTCRKTHLPETFSQNSGLNKLISLLYLAEARIIFSSYKYP